MADGVQALLTVDHPILTDDDVRVGEDFSGFLKANPVLRDIPAMLALVPLEPNRYLVSILVCTA